MGVLGRVYDWLAVAEAPTRCDAIFVLAGRDIRKDYALEAFREGLAPDILLSVGRFEIRRFCNLELPRPVDLVRLASSTAPSQRHYLVVYGNGNVVVQGVPLLGLGTWSEVRAFSDWLRKRAHVRSVAVISSGFHLRRVRLCCRRLIPDEVRVRLLAVPEEDHGLDRDHWWQTGFGRRLVVSELLKVLLYWAMARRSTNAARAWVEMDAPFDRSGK